MRKPLLKTWWFYLLVLFAIAIVAEITLFTLVVVNASRLDDPSPADAMIVLGARVREDGTPTPMLERRLNRAVELYEEGYASVIITAGAQGDDEPMTEALAMKNYLTALGVPEESVLLEDASYSTQESLENARIIMGENGMGTAIVVTSDYHLWRSLSICKDLGIEASGAGALNAITRRQAIINCLQETLSWMKYVLVEKIIL